MSENILATFLVNLTKKFNDVGMYVVVKKISVIVVSQRV